MAAGSQIIVVGAGGFGLELYDYATEIGWSPVLTDADKTRLDEAAAVGLVVDAAPDFERSPVVLAGGFPKTKSAMMHNLAETTTIARALVHPRSWVSSSAKLGPGSVVAPCAAVSTGVLLGRHVLVNYAATVGHGVVVGDLSTVGPNASIGGDVVLGAGCLIGSGAQILQGLEVGAGATVGSGAVVLRDVADGERAVGVVR